MEIIASIILIIVIYCMCKAPEWKSNNYTPPAGMKTDWGKANMDITLHGKDTFYRNHVAGKYNVPDPYYNKEK